jgi:hypothetical protein
VGVVVGPVDLKNRPQLARFPVRREREGAKGAGGRGVVDPKTIRDPFGNGPETGSRVLPVAVHGQDPGPVSSPVAEGGPSLVGIRYQLSINSVSVIPVEGSVGIRSPPPIGGHLIPDTSRLILRTGGQLVSNGQGP